MKTKHNILQEKLQKHKLPIDDTFWEEMQGRLQRQKRKKIVPLWWASGIAAALAAIVLLLMPKQEPSTEIADFQNNKIEQNESPKISEQKETMDLQTQIQKNVKQNSSANQQVKENFIIEKKYLETENQQVSDTLSDDTKNIINENENKSENQYQAKNKNDYQELKPLKTLADYENFAEKKRKQKFHKGLYLAANVSYGSGADDFTQGETIKSSRAPALANETDGVATRLDNKQADISLRELLMEYPKTTYMPPLSVGITVRKKIAEFFSLEAGLVYTYLNTKFYTSDNNEQQTATLQLHYLGIPLNAVYTFIDHPKWTLYASAGAMIEKGLSYNYQKYSSFDEKPETYTGQVERIQLSTNGTIGAALIFSKNLSVFLEPRISYFFANKQPISIRTDSPLHLELGTGLRIGF
ncbi:MAG: PorT family protein [Paludibacter sp.]|nr:PorT family protein [Paludibacter sp.]